MPHPPPPLTLADSLHETWLVLFALIPEVTVVPGTKVTLSKEEKGTTEDEMAGWHHRLNGHGFGWTPGVGDGQRGLECCSLWGCKESDTTERPN